MLPLRCSLNDRFVVLQAEVETAAKRLSETNEEAEKAGLLVELRKLPAQMDEIIHDKNSSRTPQDSN
jgi:hypothetical protein